MDRINFNKTVKMHLACANDDLRPAMSCIYFKDGFAYATDAHILVKNKISEISTLNEEQIEQLNGKLLHRKKYRDLLKYETIIISEDGIEANDQSEKVFFYFADDSMKFPDAENVISESKSKSTVSLPQIRLKVSLIKKLQSALSVSDGNLFTFKGAGNAVIVEDSNSDFESMGIIMTQYNEE